LTNAEFKHIINLFSPIKQQFTEDRMTQPIDIVISFDTTGSMYPCLAEVRRKVDETAQRLFKEIPNLRIGIIAHGDYCDRHIYVTKHLALTTDPTAVSYFVKNVERTGGGDAPECYELVLHEAHTKIKWTPGSQRVLVMIGDDVPHPKAHNPGKLDWKEEANKLLNEGVLIHGVQALNNRHAAPFYKEISDITGGFNLRLAQFNEVTELLLAVAYQQVSPEALQGYEDEVVTQKKMTRTMSDIFAKLSKRDPVNGRYRKVDTRAVDAGRFQQILVDSDKAIQALVEEQGMVFQRGRGFYEFTKRETIQAKKEVVILDNDTGDMYEGDAAREVLGLPVGSSIDISPNAAGFDRAKYKVFVQSTSNNRKLLAGTTFLYEAS
jgi:hypothetical protein